VLLLKNNQAAGEFFHKKPCPPHDHAVMSISVMITVNNGLGIAIPHRGRNSRYFYAQ
jgi:hypothetical protein